MYLVIECTRFNINWVFMFLSSVYLICHCQFLYRMAFVFSSLFLPVHTFFRHKFVFTHTHTQHACIEFRLVAPSTSKMESTTFRFSLCISLCVCVFRSCVDGIRFEGKIFLSFKHRKKMWAFDLFYY